ncbi:MAG: hypothetical protein AB7S77_17355 [Desulfatirhabdiaceae bacterium]|jgi:hypothetical protein
MIRLNLDRVKPGMILAKSVKSIQDMLLLNEYATLTDKNIKILRSWGIDSVWVEGQESVLKTESSPQGAAIREQIDRELNEKFSDVLDDPVMAEIMRLAGDQLENRFLRKEAENDSPES